jgi:multidrug efflux pump subunit AcrB
MSQVGIGFEEVRAALRSANANSPKGELANATRAWPISANDQLFDADQWRPVIVAYRNGAPVRLGDLGTVETSVEDLRTAGLANGKRAVLIIMYRQPGANMIETVDRVLGLMPLLQASIPPSITSRWSSTAPPASAPRSATSSSRCSSRSRSSCSSSSSSWAARGRPSSRRWRCRSP